MTETTDRTSVWTADAQPRPSFPTLTGDLHTEVAVVGAGAVGLTIALRLIEEGHVVTVLEARDVASGTTGGTTGKVTSQHGTIYADLIDHHGEDAARGYGQGNQAAIDTLREQCERHGIDAQSEPGDAYVYALSDDEVATLRDELDAALRLGLPAEWAESVDLPFPVRGALRFRDQLQINAVSWCDGMARAVAASEGSDVFTRTRVTDVEEVDDRVQLRTQDGTVVTAQHVVLATLAPIVDRGFETFRMTPVRAHGLAAEIAGDLPKDLYISAGEPDRSLRPYHGAHGEYLVVVGASYETGHGDPASGSDAALEEFARAHFDVTRITHRWSAQDMLPHDRLPFVGRTAFADRISVATGFQKWGLSNAFLAADVLAAQLAERPHPMTEALDPRRTAVLGSMKSAKEFVRHGADVARRFVGDRINPEAETVDDIPPGGGATVRVGGDLVAVSKDLTGRVTACSATCTHLGCIVAWNDAESSWGCPCHGSRFAPDGEVLAGPATQALAPRSVEQDGRESD